MIGFDFYDMIAWVVLIAIAAFCLWSWHKDGKDAPESELDLLEEAWGIIANADNWHGDPEWRKAAERWRGKYHNRLGL